MVIDQDDLCIRDSVTRSDVEVVGQIVRSTSYFTAEEEAIAMELVQERLEKGIASGYLFNFLDYRDSTLGYTCFGLIPCSYISYDLYWIVVSQAYRGQGLGKWLLQRSEAYIRKLGGQFLYADTSTKAQYQSTRGFYERNGFSQAAVLADFYNFGDGKVIYRKKL